MKFSVLALVLSIPGLTLAQTPCNGKALTGTVRDSTQALLPGALLLLDGKEHQQSGSDGSFRFSCVANGTHRLSVAADGFATLERPVKTPSGDLRLTLQPATVQVSVTVDADANTVPTASGFGASQTLAGDRLQSLADDPDDLLRQLQQLAATGGGNPASATISVDGFQDSSRLPPKSSIAYIKVNPDLFSAEYREPPFGGGRVEVYTKPGQSAYHGAIFTTNGSPWENARDPFSTSKAAIGKQRYGFELTGPITKKNSDFAATLEYRRIDDFAVVNAFIPDSNGNPVQTIANVATPQRLWLPTARLDWQLGPKNTFTASYSGSQNSLENVGAGGAVLAEAGYSSSQYDHTLRLSNVTTFSAKLMHEARLSFRWFGEDDTPNSTTPQVQIAGAFTGGGANIGSQRLHEFRIEYDDDAILIHGKQTVKIGSQFYFNHEVDRMTTNFNGTYIYGGSDTETGSEQYHNGTPTAYTVVTGTPDLRITPINGAIYVQDEWDLPHNLHFSGGVRYALQNDPTALNGATPRAGLIWSPGKHKWSLNAHGGLFSSWFGISDYREVLREDGTNRVTSLVYNPVYGAPFSPGATTIHSIRTFSPHYTNTSWGAGSVGGSYAFPHGWNLSATLARGRIWNYARTLNINSPLDDSPTGTRPGTANLNIYQVQPSGQGRVSLAFVMLEQHTLKHVQFFLGGVHVLIDSDTDDDTFSGPQSSRTDVGEFARRTNQAPWQIFGNSTVSLPLKLSWSTDLNARGGAPYNITTGADNNGDGNFNDRPQYAAPGTPNAIQTRWGLLTNSGGDGIFPRNKGLLPWSIYIDMNIQRTFKLTHNPKAEHQQTLVANIRSSNVLNHMNVTSVGGVLGSPTFGIPYAADNGRRVEAGLRYTF